MENMKYIIMLLIVASLIMVEANPVILPLRQARQAPIRTTVRPAKKPTRFVNPYMAQRSRIRGMGRG
uniref:Uncharacterized protein n=1 Tax=Strigamia maritima TaxID=126957 RepID=T1JDK3_STRMM